MRIFFGSFLCVLCVSVVNRVEAEPTVRIDASRPLAPVSRYLTGACIEDVNHEIYGGLYSQMLFGESFQEPPPKTAPHRISDVWRAVLKGNAAGRFDLVTESPFKGRQSQRVTFESGEGEIGIENQGLHHGGLALVADKPYEGYVWVRAEKPVELFAALESRDGSRRLAEAKLTADSTTWQRLDFTLRPTAAEKASRFVLSLKKPGSVVLGHVFLQPGSWGRFKDLPVRRDVAEGLIDQGVTVLRYGGSMVNAPEYRWKKMIGPRDRRPLYRGHWYPYSTNGWGIVDFVQFCEAAGFLAIPAFNLDETPQDMADFLAYMNGPADSEWGRKRAADGHPDPYNLRHIEIGNEERVDDNYVRKFQALAEAVWAKDPNVVLVVGDFAYDAVIEDPFHFTGAASKITTLAAHQKILELAKKHDREVWFDVHLWTEGPGKSPSTRAFPSFVAALAKVAGGARHHVVVFEFNANNHDQRRALANAVATHLTEQLGLPVATSANCLQPDGHNDNGWDQGLLFLNPSQVWLQPPGYVTRMLARHYLPDRVFADLHGADDTLDVSAKRDKEGKVLQLEVVNLAGKPVKLRMEVKGFQPGKPEAHVTELAGPLNAVNTAADPRRLVPNEKVWKHAMKDGATSYEFAPYSFTILRFE